MRALFLGVLQSGKSSKKFNLFFSKKKSHLDVYLHKFSLTLRYVYAQSQRQIVKGHLQRKKTKRKEKDKKRGTPITLITRFISKKIHNLPKLGKTTQ